MSPEELEQHMTDKIVRDDKQKWAMIMMRR
jgi:hypothetical protein